MTKQTWRTNETGFSPALWGSPELTSITCVKRLCAPCRRTRVTAGKCELITFKLHLICVKVNDELDINYDKMVVSLV